VVVVDTDIDGEQFRALGRLVDKFPFGDQVKESLRDQIEQTGDGIDFDEDVKPVLGNPFVLAAPNTDAIDSDLYIGAFKAEDKEALERLVRREASRKSGEAAGATLYTSGDSAYALKDDMLVYANDEGRLRAALERAEGDDHLDEDAFNEGLEGLPQKALLRVTADLEAFLKADPGSADALQAKWVAAVRTLGFTVAAKENALDLDFRVSTEGDLADEDLPIAPGDDAPPVIEREAEVGLGIRDLAHIVGFGENAAQAIDPAGFGDYAQAKKTIDRQLGVSLDDDLVGQLTGNIASSVSLTGEFGVRSELKDPQAFERTLAKVADVLPNFAEGAGLGTVGLSKPGPGEDFYALAQADGDSIVFGVVDEVLVVATTPARASELASEEPAAVPGARGSVVVSADAEQIVNTLIEVFGPTLGIPDLGGFGTGLLTRPLGDVNGYLSASTGELRGKFSLAIE
jgi:hypothetical protein